jgi:hypothetical protein
MSYLQLDEQQRGLTRSQIVNSVVIAVTAVFLMGLGVLMRDAATAATVPYENEQSGIRARIPANWLVTTNEGDIVVQAEDPQAIPFKTLLRVSLVAVGEEATPRNVVDSLTLQRAGRLSTYRVLSIEPLILGEDEALQMDYAFVQADNNPFLSAVPQVIQGRDVVVIRGNQAIVITYLEERSRFAEHEILFDNFLESLEF